MTNLPIYIINCHNESRKKRMIDRFKHVDLMPTFNCFTDISGIEQKYHMTLTIHDKVMLSHMNCIKKFYESNKPLGIICEDDIYIHKTLDKEIEKVTTFITNNQYDILLLGYLLNYKPPYHYHNLITSFDKYKVYDYNDELWGLQMYMITRKYAKYLLDNFPIQWKFDNPKKAWASDWIISKNGKRAMIYPMLAVEEGDRICDNDSSQKRYHRECNRIQYNSKIYI
tara:strand:+ start:923 stop:1600 length:678 start_codon:yes stop_codon:yes gene_type:complete